MALPKSVVKVKKSGVEYVSHVDRAKYTIAELSRAALRDVAKVLRTLMKRAVPVDEGVLKKNIGSWVIAKAMKLQIGVYDRQRAKKKGYTYAYHAHLVEFGTKGMPAKPFLKRAVVENIDEIRKVQAQYLKQVEDELKAKGLINEQEEIADD